MPFAWAVQEDRPYRSKYPAIELLKKAYSIDFITLTMILRRLRAPFCDLGEGRFFRRRKSSSGVRLSGDARFAPRLPGTASEDRSQMGVGVGQTAN